MLNGLNKGLRKQSMCVLYAARSLLQRVPKRYQESGQRHKMVDTLSTTSLVSSMRRREEVFVVCCFSHILDRITFELVLELVCTLF